MRDYQRSHRLLCQLFGVTLLVLTLATSRLLLYFSFPLPLVYLSSSSLWYKLFHVGILICTKAKESQLLKKKNREEKRQQVKYLTHPEAKMLLQHFITTLAVQTLDELLSSFKWVTSKGRKLFFFFFAQILTFLFSGLKHGQRMNMDDFSFGKHRALMTRPTLWLTVISWVLDSSDTKTKQCWELCIFTISFCF